MRIAQYECEGKTIVYIDESGFPESMPRTHSYSPKGERAYGTHAWNEKGRINVIGAIINQVFLTLCLFSQNINADTFFAWVTQDLLPKIQPIASL